MKGTGNRIKGTGNRIKGKGNRIRGTGNRNKGTENRIKIKDGLNSEYRMKNQKKSTCFLPISEFLSPSHLVVELTL